MREIVQVQGGCCGNQLGMEYLQQVACEHGLDPTGSSLSLCPESCFAVTADGRYQPRTVLFDLKSGTLDHMRSGLYGHLFSPSNIVSDNYGSSLVWPKAYYGRGAELAERVMESVRREVERCESPQGFHLLHSLGGGTGSGMGSLLASKLKETYPTQILLCTSVLPSAQVSNAVVEPYNAILALSHIMDSADAMVLLNNESLHSICYRILKLTTPSYADLNYVAAAAVSGVTCTLREPGSGVNSTLRKLVHNLVPLSRLFCISVALAPVRARNSSMGRTLLVSELVSMLFGGRAAYCSSDPSHGRYLSLTVTMRGKTEEAEVIENLDAVGNKDSSHFVEWIPDNVKHAAVPTIAQKLRRSAVAVGNTTAVQESLSRELKEFTALYSRKSFIRNYEGEGMKEVELMEAEMMATDLISEYQMY